MSFDKNLLPEPLAYFESQGLVLDGRGKWRTTRCEFHDGSDSVRINTHTGGWVCMACGEHGGDVLAYEMQRSGLEFVEACKALGAWVDDGKPQGHNKPTALPLRDAMAVITFEATLFAIEATRWAKGIVPTTEDAARLREAAARIAMLCEEFSI